MHNQQKSAQDLLNALGGPEKDNDGGNNVNQGVDDQESGDNPESSSGSGSGAAESDEESSSGEDDTGDSSGQTPQSQQSLPQQSLPTSFFDWGSFQDYQLTEKRDIIKERLLGILAIYETLKAEVGVMGNSAKVEGFLSVARYLLHSEDLLAFFRCSNPSILLPTGISENENLENHFSTLFDTAIFSGFDLHMTVVMYSGDRQYGSITLFKLGSPQNDLLPDRIRPKAAMRDVPKILLIKISSSVKYCSKAKLQMPQRQIWKATKQTIRQGLFARRILMPSLVANGPGVGNFLKQYISMPPATIVQSFQATVPQLIAMLHHKTQLLENIKSSEVRNELGDSRHVKIVQPPVRGSGGGINTRIIVLSTVDAPWVEEALSWT